MSAPTETEIQAQISNLIIAYHKTWTALASGSDSWVTREDTFLQDLEGDSPFVSQVMAAVAGSRGQLAGVYGSQGVTAALAPLLAIYSKVINKPELTDAQAIFNELIQRFKENSLYVQSRGVSFGAVSAGGSNVGTNTIVRVTKDDYGNDLEAVFAETLSFECINDQNSGTRFGEEKFSVKGQNPGVDALGFGKSGINTTLDALSADSPALLANPSFGSGSLDSTTTGISGWTSSITVSAANYAFDSTNFFRKTPSEGTAPRSLQIKATGNLTQKLSTRGIALNPNIPYMLQLAYNRQVNSDSGTLTVRMGAVSTAVAVSAQTGWQIVRIPSTLGQNNWIRAFDENDMDIAIEWSRSGGSGLLLDDVIFAPMTPIGGSWWNIVPASTAAYVANLKGDTYTVANTISSDSILNQWFFRALGKTLPAIGNSLITWADPS